MREETLSSLQVPAFSIGIMSDVLERAGIDPTPAFSRIGVDPAKRLPDSGAVSARAEYEFERAFLSLTPGRRDLWTEVGRRHRLYAYGVFGLVIGTAPTLREYVEASSLSRDLCFTFSEFPPIRRNGVLCGTEFRTDAVPEDLREMTLYRDLGAASSVIGEIWHGAKRGFCMEVAVSPADAGFLADVFPFKVKFDCDRTALTWPAHFTDAPLPHGSEYLYRYYWRQCTAILNEIYGSDLEANITRIIMLQPSAYRTIEAVARRINMSVRTLQRRLGEEGRSFREILGRANVEAAKAMLQGSSLSVSQIAVQLGYSERTSFDLAFSRQTGTSPRKFRALAGVRTAT